MLIESGITIDHLRDIIEKYQAFGKLEVVTEKIKEIYRIGMFDVDNRLKPDGSLIAMPCLVFEVITNMEGVVRIVGYNTDNEFFISQVAGLIGQRILDIEKST